jgi:hypothetical protein
MTKLRSFFNKPATKGTTFRGKSQTTPDQSLTIREVIRRFSAGTLPPIAKESLTYNEEYPDTRFMDISEKSVIINAAKTQQENGKQQIKDLKNQKAADAKKAHEEKLQAEAIANYKKNLE